MKSPLLPAGPAKAAAWIALLLCMVSFVHAQTPPAAKSTVGIFSRAAVVQVYYRSAVWKAKMQAMIDNRNKAVAANDVATADRFDQEFAATQALAQKQLTGEAPLTNIYEQLAPEWPAIAKEAGVDIIIDTPIYQTMSARVIDVTPFIFKRLSTAPRP